MRLLISVRNTIEATAAVAGGADIVDAKDPEAGALGTVDVAVYRDIHAAVGGRTPVSAALGDAQDEAAVRELSQQFAAAGAAFVKIGFAGIRDVARAGRMISAAATATADVVAVAYADAESVDSLSPAAVIEIAAWNGARGVLLDTATKTGPGVRELMTARALAAWARSARNAGLFTAIAGKLTAHDLAFVSDLGVDIAGIRGAACDGGRNGRLSADKVRLLRRRTGASAFASAAITERWR